MRPVFEFLDRRPLMWLVVGTVLLSASQLRWGVDALAWVAWVPFLRALRLRAGVAFALATAVAGMVAMTLAVAKLATDPVPLVMAPAFGVGIGLFLGAPLVAFAATRRRLAPGLDERWRAALAVLFAAFMVVGEWLQHALTELGSWGAAAYTQTGDLALLQIASVTGLGGVSFLVYLVNGALEHTLHTARTGTPRWGAVAAAAGVWLAVQVAGSARLASFEVATETVRVAAVGTDATFGGLPLPSPGKVSEIDATLERRVRMAAAQDVEVVVWNEGSTVVRPEDRDRFFAHWSAVAKELDIELVAAWITPIALDPLRYENVSVTFRPDGSASAPYLKHHPVPGEPAVAGTGPLSALETAAGRLGTAICYDGDFPRLGLRHAANGVSLLAVPSSDWRGIDPLHTQMITLRAIEGGYSVLRSTRLGLSAGIDASGRMRATHSWFDSSDRVMVVDLPGTRTWTLYGVLGDWFVAACGAACAWAAGLAFALRFARARVVGSAWLRPFLSSEFARS